jgi:DNA-binding XRE family transcriptional regulator
MCKRRLSANVRKAQRGDSLDVLPLPTPDADGNYPAVAFGRASLARKLVSQRRAAGLSIQQLARKAKVSAKTMQDLESGAKAANVSAIDKIDRVLSAARA